MSKDTIHREMTEGLAWAGGMIALALGATLARRLGAIDADTVLRLVIGVNGLMVAWYGNRMPKTFVPSVRVQQAKRVGGWSMVLSGLAYAALWVFAPIRVATFGGCAALIAGIAVTVGYCLWLRAKAKAV
jgi:hypothetical protein